MTKIQFKDLPDRSTPRNATNLNKLNNVSVGTTEPTLDEEIWINKSKNLIISGLLNWNLNNGKILADSTRYAYMAKVKPNTTYTISRSSVGSSSFYYYGKFKSMPSVGASVSGIDLGSSSLSNTITTDNDTQYIVIFYGAGISPQAQVENGSTKTSYEAPIQTEINVNNNGVYNKLTDTVSVGVEPNNAGLWIEYEELYNINEITPNTYLDHTNRGATGSSTSTNITNYAKVEQGKTYYIKCTASSFVNTASRSYGWYNDSKQWISGDGYYPADMRDGKVKLTAPQNGYLRIAYDKNCTNISISSVNNSSIKTNNNGTYEKVTDTVNIGSGSNNAGLWVEASKQAIKYDIGTTTANGITFTINADQSITMNGTATAQYALQLITSNKLTDKNGSKAIISCEDLPNGVSVGCANSDWGNSQNLSGTNKKIEFNIVNNIRYYWVSVANGTKLTNVTIHPMIELGDNYTGYEPYITPNIKVNNNGVYETIANKNIYSTGEVVIGEWLGKPLYRKVILSTVTSDMQSSSQTITRIGDVRVKRFESYFNNVNSVGTVPGGTRFSETDQVWAYVASEGDIKARVYGSYVGREIEIIIEYTKTTD